MKKTAADLEQAIMALYQTSDDLDLYIRAHIDGPVAFDEDKQMNIIHGLIDIHKLRCDAAMDLYCQVFELNEYCTDSMALEARDELFNSVFEKKKGSKKK